MHTVLTWADHLNLPAAANFKRAVGPGTEHDVVAGYCHLWVFATSFHHENLANKVVCSILAIQKRSPNTLRVQIKRKIASSFHPVFTRTPAVFF